MSKQDKGYGKKYIPTPPHPGMAQATIWCLYGFITLFLPNYLKIVGPLRIVPNVFGTLFIILSIGLAVMELSNLWKNEGWDFIGLSLILLVPAIFLHFVVTLFITLIFPLELVAKVVVLVLAAFGGTCLIIGLFYIFGTPAEQRKVTKKRDNFKTIVSFIIPLLDIVIFIVKLVWEFGK